MMKSTTHKENLGSSSCMDKKVRQHHHMKRRKRFQTMKKLVEIKETPWSDQFRPKQQGGIGVEEEKYDEEQMHSPSLKFSKEKDFHPSLRRVVAKKPRQLGSCKRRMEIVHDLCGQVEATSSVMQRAKAVQENLDPKFPSFVKPLIRSHVTGGFWLSLPNLFCKLHLPCRDTTIILEDDNHEEYSTKYLAERKGLSAGWRGFSIAHNLVEGDVLVFHMVRVTKLKVYIIRPNHLAEVDAALCLLHLDANAKQVVSGQRWDNCRGLQSAGDQHLKYFPQTVSRNIFENDAK